MGKRVCDTTDVQFSAPAVLVWSLANRARTVGQGSCGCNCVNVSVWVNACDPCECVCCASSRRFEPSGDHGNSIAHIKVLHNNNNNNNNVSPELISSNSTFIHLVVGFISAHVSIPFPDDCCTWTSTLMAAILKVKPLQFLCSLFLLCVLYGC